MRWLALLLAAALAACGADGDPEPVGSGVQISGEARIGVSGTL